MIKNNVAKKPAYKLPLQFGPIALRMLRLLWRSALCEIMDTDLSIIAFSLHARRETTMLRALRRHVGQLEVLYPFVDEHFEVRR